MKVLSHKNKQIKNKLVNARTLSLKTIIMAIILPIGTSITGCADFNFTRFNHYGSPSTQTPYDLRYHKIKRYLIEAQYRISYKAEKKGRDYWQLPLETENSGTGDCEDMAIWLYAKLLKEDIENIRLVVGKYNMDRKTRHVWINWYYNKQVYIIDPTMDVDIWRAEQYPTGYYQPLYSYNITDKWIHTN